MSPMPKTIGNSVSQRGPEIRGIVAAARALNCSRQYLWAVIRKKRVSLKLLGRYRQLKRQQRRLVP
jgi:hypothetical protein